MKSQKFKFFLMAVLICILPLILFSALRPPYLYFVVNLLVIFLGAEAGLLSFIISKTSDHHHHHQEKKTTTFSTHQDHTNLAKKPTIPIPTVSSSEIPATTPAGNAKTDEESSAIAKINPFKIIKVVEKSSISLKINVTAVSRLHKGLKKSPTRPSLFFIAGGDDREHEEEDDHRDFMIEDEEDYDNSDDNKELFQKAETFIGNFYKQLKMQRENSRNSIHGLAAYMHANPNSIS